MSENFVVSGDGVNIWTIRTGEDGGYPVMLCSGGPGCGDYLEPVAEMLDRTNQVIRFEQRGCGRSQSAPSYTIETCLTDLENIRRHYGIDRWIIGGHSWGADLALIYALEYARHAAGLICLAGGRMHNDRDWHSEYKRRKAEEGERLPAYLYPPNPEVNEQVNRDWKCYVQNPRLFKAISTLNVPALFVYGAKDIRPSWAVEQIANLMPNARFELIEEAAHTLWFSHPDELKTLLRDFVNEIKGKQMN